MYVNTSVAPGLHCKLKLPSKSVTVPLEVPLIMTEAPMTPSPVSSFTRPLMVVCAETSKAKNMTARNTMTALRLFVLVFFIVNWF